MKLKNSRWTMVMVGAIAFLVLATMVWASPPAGAPSAPLEAYDANNADKVDGLHASKKPKANTLLALRKNKKFPARVIPAYTKAQSNARFLNDDREETIEAAVLGALLTVNNTGTGNSWGLYAKGDMIGVYGQSTSGWGVKGESSSAIGVCGISGSSDGVKGQSTSGWGVHGWSGSTNKAGVYGESSNGWGVYGSSYASQGVHGESSTNIGVHAFSNSGLPLHVMGFSGTNLIEAWDDGDSPDDLRFKVVRSTGDVYADGSFTGSGADFAEMMATSQGITYEPGDLLVIGSHGKPLPSSAPSATNLLGVYSSDPGFVGGVGEDGDTTGKIPVAITGIVPVKASAENGAILPGDLLTSSSTPGHAMKASPVTINGITFYLPGTILGKALERLEEGTGVILVLVTLQ